MIQKAENHYRFVHTHFEKFGLRKSCENKFARKLLCTQKLIKDVIS